MKKELYSSPFAHQKMTASKLYSYSLNKQVMILDKKTLKYINVHDAEIGVKFITFFDEWLLVNGELFNNELKFKPNDEVLFLTINQLAL